MSCNKIASDIAHQCVDKLKLGLKDKATFINLDDIDKTACTFDANNKLICTSIVLKTASPALRAFTVEGYNYSNEHDTALAKGKFIDSWDHNFRFRIFDNTPEVKAWINDAAGSRFAIIIENNYSNINASPAGTTVFEVLGFENGLEIAEAVRNSTDEDMKGGWNILASCDEVNKEPYPPYTLYYAGGEAATRSAIDSLVA